LKLKRATWKLRAEALRRYRNRHRGSLDRAEEEMDNILKPKISRVSKTPTARSASGDSVFDNNDAQALDSGAEKCEAERLDFGKIKGKSPLFTAEVSEIAKDDRSHKHHSTVTGSKKQDADAPVKVSGNKEPKTSPVTQQNGPIPDAAIAAISRAEAGRETSELESVYEEDESVFDDALDYETSSVSVGIFTDRVLSELPTEEDASNYVDGKLPPESEAVRMSTNFDDESMLPENAQHRAVKPTGEKFPEDKFSDANKTEPTATGCTAEDKNRRQSQTSGKSLPGIRWRSSKSDNKDSNEQSSDSAEGAQDLHPVPPDKAETTDSADKMLQQSQVGGQSSAGSSERSSQMGRIICDDDDNNEHVSDSSNLQARQMDAEAADNTGCFAVDDNLEQRRRSSSVSSQKASQSRTVSGHDSASSSRSSRNDINSYVAAQNTLEDAALANNSTTPSKTHIRSAGSSDRHTRSDSVHELASVYAGNKERSTGKPRSLRSTSHSASSTAGSGHYQVSAADAGAKTKSDVTASPLQQQYSFESSSGWHLATMLYEDNEHIGKRRSPGRNSSSETSSAKSSKSSSSSEWHMRTLLFENSNSSIRQMSGDLHARVFVGLLMLTSFL